MITIMERKKERRYSGKIKVLVEQISTGGLKEMDTQKVIMCHVSIVIVDEQEIAESVHTKEL